MAGILRAESVLRRRRPPYFKALTAFVLVTSLGLVARPASTQNIEHYEGILIDTSGSISRGGTTNELFREYLVGTKKLLLTEPEKSRVWVSVISTDSFGVHEILKGWTPEAHGVFTDDLMRARRQLAASFEAKSSGMSPVATGTDIIDGLWHMKALFESDPTAKSRSVTKTIWIFSDMMNETKSFPMPALLGTGAEQIIERAKSNGLIVDLKGTEFRFRELLRPGSLPRRGSL